MTRNMTEVRSDCSVCKGPFHNMLLHAHAYSNVYICFVHPPDKATSTRVYFVRATRRSARRVRARLA